jgi:hypothetical protein
MRSGTIVRDSASMTMYQLSQGPSASEAPTVGTLRLRKETRGTVRRKTIDLKTRMQYSRVRTQKVTLIFLGSN